MKKEITMIAFLSVVFGICATVIVWIFPHPQATITSTQLHHHHVYDPNPTIVLPLSAFGVNWKMQFFRKNIPFPDNFSIAFPRALEEARKISEITDYKTEISLPPRTYYIRSPLLIEGHDLSINGNGSTLRYESQ